MCEINQKHQKQNKEIFLSNLPIELSRYIYDYIPQLYCNQCYKKLINYNKCYIYYHIQIHKKLFCSYYCAIRYKYNKYIYFLQWNLIVIAFRISIIISYLIIIPYILLNLMFILIFRFINMVVLGAF